MWLLTSVGGATIGWTSGTTAGWGGSGLSCVEAASCAQPGAATETRRPTIVTARRMDSNGNPSPAPPDP